MFRQSKKNYYYSPKLKALGLSHGVSTRFWGDLRPQGENFRSSRGREFLACFGATYKNFVFMDQVHGSRVKAVVFGKTAPFGREIIKTDGLVTSSPGLFLGVKTADCLPLVLFDPVKKIVGLAHVGWRGFLKGIVPSLVTRIVAEGALAKNSWAALGPHLCPRCFQVGPEVAVLFEKQGLVEKKPAGLFINLQKGVLNQLAAAGLDLAKAKSSGFCTSCHHDRFFSYRKKDPDNHGMILTVAGFRSSL